MILKYFDYIKDVNDIDYNVMGFFLKIYKWIEKWKNKMVDYFL